MKIGIIGNGFVGSAISEGFKLYCSEIRIYDKNALKSTHSLKDVLSSDFVFVCVPTPMTSLRSSKADTSIIESVFLEAKKSKPNCIFVIKSTVPVGT